MSRCPGQDTQTWGYDAIFDVVCPHCQSPVEFFKDELKRKCPSCGERIFNDRMDLGCAKWCPMAASCVGPDSLRDLEVNERRKARREDLLGLLDMVPEGGTDVRELFKTLYGEYPKDDALFDTNRLHTVQERDADLFERATAIFRAFLDKKAAEREREALARRRTEEMLKNDQRRKHAREPA
jgi:endogenous inhibitor of DNA gyrase (YacG/DUF329 family)